MSVLKRALILSLSGCLLASTGWAMPSFTIDLAGGDPAEDLTQYGTFTGPDQDGVTAWELGGVPVSIEGGLAQIDDWNAQMKPDPFVTNNITVTNTSGSTQTFIATVILPIPAFDYDQITGSVGVSVTDSDSQNGMLFDNVDPMSVYEATINGSLALGLDFASQPIELADCEPFSFDGCSASDSTTQPFIAAGPGTANQIGITLRFDLSPGDSAALTSRFEIVPEPAAAALLGLGLTALAVRRRLRA